MLTHMVVILDRSGSMGSCYEATVTGFDEFVQKQQDEEGEATLTLAQFDDQYEVVYDEKPIQDVVSIKDVYRPRGATALLDAIGKTINTTAESLIMKTKTDTPDRILCVIITDGFENASKEYSRDQIKKLVTEKEEGNWEFIFLGANQDAIMVGAELGVKMGSSATYNTKNTENVWLHANNKVACYRNMSGADMADLKSGASAMFDAEDREDLAKED